MNAPDRALAVRYSDVAAAAERLAGQAHRTPVLTSHIVNERTGAEVFFKCENFQRMGAFKFRGAYNAMSRLAPMNASEASSPTPQATTRRRWLSQESSSAFASRS